MNFSIEFSTYFRKLWQRVSTFNFSRINLEKFDSSGNQMLGKHPIKINRFKILNLVNIEYIPSQLHPLGGSPETLSLCIHPQTSCPYRCKQKSATSSVLFKEQLSYLFIFLFHSLSSFCITYAYSLLDLNCKMS